MTTAELKTEVFRRLQESQTSPVFWSAADVLAAINEGYQEISDATEWYEQIRTIDLLRERPYYDLRKILPSSCLRLTAAYNDQTSRWLIPCTPRDLDTFYRQWELTTGGEPSHQLLRGLWWMRVWPMNAADGGTIQQHYTAIPPALTADTDVPGFPINLHYGLVEYALADLWAQDAEATLATTSWKVYLAYEAALMEFVQGRVAVPMVKGLTGGEA